MIASASSVQNRIMLVIPSAYPHPLALAAAAPAAGAAVRSAAGPLPATRTAAVAATQPVLRLGARGGAVVTLQRRLAALHYFDVGAADGVFGAGTYHAVVAFQKVQGLTRDGVAGQATWVRLARPFVPAPRYRLATGSLEVDLTRQVVYYIRNGAVQRIVDSSTGSGAWYYSRGRWARAITPTGRFRIYWRYSSGWQPGPSAGVSLPLTAAGRIRIQNGRSAVVAQDCRSRAFSRLISASS